MNKLKHTEARLIYLTFSTSSYFNLKKKMLILQFKHCLPGIESESLKKW